MANSMFTVRRGKESVTLEQVKRTEAHKFISGVLPGVQLSEENLMQELRDGEHLCNLMLLISPDGEFSARHQRFAGCVLFFFFFLSSSPAAILHTDDIAPHVHHTHHVDVY
jgi:hypothetical protein